MQLTAVAALDVCPSIRRGGSGHDGLDHGFSLIDLQHQWITEFDRVIFKLSWRHTHDHPMHQPSEIAIL
jgi:hypothetical protein